MITFTKDILNQGKSSNNGWNKKQLEALGVTKLKKGWVNILLGKSFKEEQIKQFLELKDYHFRNRAEGVFKSKKDKKFPKFTPCDKNLPYKDQYLHPNWQKMRLFVLNRDKFACVNCNDTESTLHVHHLKYDRKNFVWSVPHWYLVTLCNLCHDKEHGK